MSFLSERIVNMRESETLAIARKVSELKAQGQDVINLGLGEPDFPTPSPICEAAITAIKSGKYYAYPPVAGYADVRAVIAEKFIRENGIASGPEHIVVSTGAKQSIANVVLSTVNPGDEVVIAAPYWVSYPSIVELAGGKPIYATTRIEDGYKLQPAALDKALSTRTKVFIFSSPSNPTGAVLDADALHALSEVLRRYPQVLIIADEIYEYMNFSNQHTSLGAVADLADRCVTINGLSKGFAMTGWRIGYMHAPKPIAKACEKIQGQYTSGANTIAQRAIPTALQHAKESTHLMRTTYQQRSQLTHKLLGTIPGIISYLPQGAYYMFPNISAYFGKQANGFRVEDTGTFCLYLLAEAQVATVSGKAFGDANCLRMSFCTSEKNLREAITRLRHVLQKLS